MNPERGVVVWVTSASATAAQEAAVAVAEALAARELRVELLHADRPGFESIATPAALATTAGLLAGHGVHAVIAEAVSSRRDRETARRTLGAMIEVSVQSGATAAASWESAAQAEVEVDASAGPAGVSRVLTTLEVLGYIKPEADQAYSADEEREVIKRLKAFGYM
jgi:hypothetical protein